MLTKYEKLNLKVGERVQITGFPTNDPLQNTCGINLGPGVVDVVDTYIILLDEPTKTHNAIMIPEGCLRRVL